MAGNWKMYKTAAETTSFFEKFRPLVERSEHCEIVICPPYPSLPAALAAAQGSRIGIGAQNMFWAKEGAYTGPKAVAAVLDRHPELTLVIAHLGMDEYDAFADLVEAFPHVHLDTTMAGTDFSNQFAPLTPAYVERLASLGDRVVLGSDFPNIPYPYAHQIEALHRLGLGDEWMRKVLWHNGARLLRLEDEDA